VEFHKKIEISLLTPKMVFPLFTPIPHSASSKIFHGIPPMESAFYHHPILNIKSITFFYLTMFIFLEKN
jgi:hypothetical protein